LLIEQPSLKQTAAWKMMIKRIKKVLTCSFAFKDAAAAVDNWMMPIPAAAADDANDRRVFRVSFFLSLCILYLTEISTPPIFRSATPIIEFWA
jgi:hypothetical protein